jgi:hypothetical protein
MAFDALVGRTKQISKASWSLADCAAPGTSNGRFFVNYHKGYLPGTVIVTTSEGPDGGEDLAFVLNSFEQDGAMGTVYTELSGEGRYAYSAAGRHAQPLSSFEIRRVGGTNFNRLSTKIETLDSELGECKITNLNHIESLLASH